MAHMEYTAEQKASAVTMEELVTHGVKRADFEPSMVVIDEGTPNPYYFNVSPIGVAPGGATVYRCSDTKDHYALKVMMRRDDNNNQQEFEEFLEETQRNDDLLFISDHHHHDNLVRFRDVKLYDSQERILGVVMDYMMDRSFRKIMRYQCPSGLPEERIAVALKESLKALSHLHGKNQIHKQVNAGHIFWDENGAVRLAFAACIYEDNEGHEASGPGFLPESDICTWAAAPEVFHSGNYSPKSDIWMIGITALELGYGALKVENRVKLEARIVKMIAEKRLPKHSVELKPVEAKLEIKNLVEVGRRLVSDDPWKRRFSKGFEKMVIKCLAWDPTERPTADELLQTRFFRKTN